jgi:hypothetical protein
VAKKPPAEPKPPGRPTKCTPEKIAEIAAHMRDGLWAQQACCLAKIDEATYYRWVERGNEGREPYAAFCEAIKEAEVQAEKNALDTVRMGAVGSEAVNWQSASWYLERRYPARYGRRDPDKMALSEMDKRLKQLEIETAEAKLALLKAGHDPDGATIIVNIPEALSRES